MPLYEFRRADRRCKSASKPLYARLVCVAHTQVKQNETRQDKREIVTMIHRERVLVSIVIKTGKPSLSILYDAHWLAADVSSVVPSASTQSAPLVFADRSSMSSCFSSVPCFLLSPPSRTGTAFRFVTTYQLCSRNSRERERQTEGYSSNNQLSSVTYYVQRSDSQSFFPSSFPEPRNFIIPIIYHWRCACRLRFLLFQGIHIFTQVPTSRF